MSAGKRQSVGADDTESRSEVHDHLVELVEQDLGSQADAYAAVDDGEYAFVLAAWRAEDAVVRSVRFGCRLNDAVARQIGVRNTHYVDESAETATWTRQFLHGREQRALKITRAQFDWEGRRSRWPFDGPFFGAGF